MKKITFFASVLLVGCVMFTSCSHDDVTKEVIPQKTESSVNAKVAAVMRLSSNIPACSDSSPEEFKGWVSSLYNLLTNTNSATNKKYIWKQSSIVNGIPRSFKVEFTNKANYPITVRVTGCKINWLSPSVWTVVRGCQDLNTNGSTCTFDLTAPSTTDYLQFEVIVMNKNYAGQPSRTSVPVNVRLCNYTRTPCF